MSSNNPYVFFDLKYGVMKAGRVIIQLYADVVPKAAENFRALCTGEKGIGRRGKPLHYKGTKFHKVIPLCMVQGGDIENNDGTGGESIYGPTFEDESLTIKHEEEGMVGMMNAGPNTNQSQFYITTQPCSHLDDTNVVVGKIVKGLKIIVEMSDYNREDSKPPELLIIENCGELKPGEPWNINESDGTEDVYPPWPDDWDEFTTANSRLVEKAVIAIKESGNFYFGENDFVDSERKYVKCLRYINWYLLQNKKNLALKSMRIIVMQNLAAALLKRQKFKETVKLCSEILAIDENNAKALYRRGQASLAMKDYDEALDDLNNASSFLPNDRNVLNLLNTVKKHKFIYLQDEKLFFSKLFN
ncbi:unnamed protein product [Phaedon cochleariae]|uniref:peptidylprolyl isomerase n=1 Tax=Phaedon cochleariae TaxID=80249 RepID=A0A9P0GMU9_PHACE|nr:unnamed protein product [Phaedon cochleariae]